MSLIRCPGNAEKKKALVKMQKNCPNCGFSFKQKDLEMYKQRLEAWTLSYNEEVNQKHKLT